MFTYSIRYVDDAEHKIVGVMLSHDGNRIRIEDEDGDLWVLNWDHITGFVVISNDEE